MSRIGKNPVEVPSGVEISIVNDLLTAKGKNGVLTVPLHEAVEVKQQDGTIVVSPREGAAAAQKMWGTMRSMINNAVVGASEGFTVRLEINGVGYRAAVQGSSLNLQLGYSHDINYPIPQGISVKCERPTLIEISGANKQQVGQFASEIRAFRKPEPYKGKGVKYENETIVRKEGKKK
ncbi:MAG: 50S ribosomal protein L6 [Alphaproteobacteria bacterium]|nr:50S ribosomal protein L6 [Alphaproteobacteria bacterium]